MSEIDLDTQGAQQSSEADQLAERCRLLGIDWLEKAPDTNPETIALIEPDVADG